MRGALIATLIGGAVYLLGDNVAPESAFLTGTNFLFWWYLVTSVIGLAIVGLIALGIMGGGTFAGASSWGIGGGILGAIAGGGLGLFILALTVVFSGMRIAGAYILHDSVALTEGVYVWDVAKVVVGGLLVGLPLLFRSGPSSSSSRSS